MKLLIIILSILFSASFLYQFIMDYKKERYIMASFELIFTIIYLACGIYTVCIALQEIL